MQKISINSLCAPDMSVTTTTQACASADSSIPAKSGPSHLENSAKQIDVFHLMQQQQQLLHTFPTATFANQGSNQGFPGSPMVPSNGASYSPYSPYQQFSMTPQNNAGLQMARNGGFQQKPFLSGARCALPTPPSFLNPMTPQQHMYLPPPYSIVPSSTMGSGMGYYSSCYMDPSYPSQSSFHQHQNLQSALASYSPVPNFGLGNQGTYAPKQALNLNFKETVPDFKKMIYSASGTSKASESSSALPIPRGFATSRQQQHEEVASESTVLGEDDEERDKDGDLFREDDEDFTGDGKPVHRRGYWSEFANLRRELLAFIEKMGDRIPPGRMPTQKELREGGAIGTMKDAIRRHGGTSVVARMMGLKTAASIGKNGRALEALREEILAFLKENDQDTNTLPGAAYFREHGRKDIVHSVRALGGFAKIAEQFRWKYESVGNNNNKELSSSGSEDEVTIVTQQ